LGIYIQDVTPELAEALGLDVEQGAVVTQVEPGSAAEQAGIMAGDVVTELNGMAVEGSSDLRNRVGLVRIGAEVDLTYVRDGRVRHATAVIKGGQGTTLTPSGGETIDRLDGAEFSNLGSDNPHYGDVEGVVVSRVAQGSRAEQNGLQSGDIITAVNRTPVTNVQELALAIANAPGAIALNILRDDARLFIVIQ
jgi:serine protease DegQ